MEKPQALNKSSGISLSQEQTEQMLMRLRELEAKEYIQNLMDEKTFRAILLQNLQQIQSAVIDLKQTILSVSQQESLVSSEEKETSSKTIPLKELESQMKAKAKLPKFMEPDKDDDEEDEDEEPETEEEENDEQDEYKKFVEEQRKKKK